MAHKILPSSPTLPNPGKAESSYDLVLNRALRSALVDIALAVNHNSAILHEATLGAADSGGVGFRLVRVPN